MNGDCMRSNGIKSWDAKCWERKKLSCCQTTSTYALAGCSMIDRRAPASKDEVWIFLIQICCICCKKRGRNFCNGDDVHRWKIWFERWNKIIVITRRKCSYLIWQPTHWSTASSFNQWSAIPRPGCSAILHEKTLPLASPFHKEILLQRKLSCHF